VGETAPETGLRDGGAREPSPASVESRASWTAAFVSLAVLAVINGANLVIVVGLRTMQIDLDVPRSVVALAGGMTAIATGAGGILMGWLADKIGIRNCVLFGVLMVTAGLALCSTGHVWALFVGQGVLIGFFGMGAIFPPLMVYVSRWFDRRRGTAIALISSGQYIAGVVWPAVFDALIEGPGWRATYLMFAGVALLGTAPLAILFLKPAPGTGPGAVPIGAARTAAARVLGLPPNLVQGILCLAGLLCCIPMSVPQTHLVAICGDVGLGGATGSIMFSTLLACAFVSRQFWGLFADRRGGLKCIFAASACQMVAVGGYLLTDSELGMYTVSAAFGLGFSGLIPAYIVSVRELFPSSEASWRVPLFMFTAMGGMTVGSWLAGHLFDVFGSYGPAFIVGVLANVANLMLIGTLVMRQRKWPYVLRETSAPATSMQDVRS
jgi:MFS family permease